MSETSEISDSIKKLRTGQEMRFLSGHETSEGDRLVAACLAPPVREMEPLHCHPMQRNTLEVQSGHLGLRLDGQKQILGPGESRVLEAGTAHQVWVVGDEPAEYLDIYEPALNSEALFRTLFWLDNAGHLKANGLPNPLIMAELGLYFWEEMQVVRPHPLVQRIVYSAIWPFSTVFGYNAYVRQFG